MLADAEAAEPPPPEIVADESSARDVHPGLLSAILVLLLPLNALQLLFASLALSILSRHTPPADGGPLGANHANDGHSGRGDDAWTRPWADDGTAGYAVSCAVASLVVFVGHALSEARASSAAKRRRAFYLAGCAVGYGQLYALFLAIRDAWHFISFGVGAHGDRDALWLGLWLAGVALVAAVSVFVVLGYMGMLKRIMRGDVAEMQERPATETEPLLGNTAMIHPGLSYQTHAEVR